MTTRPPFSGYFLPGSGTGGGALASIAQFSDTTDQPVTTSPTVITFNTTDYASGGITPVTIPGVGAGEAIEQHADKALRSGAHRHIECARSESPLQRSPARQVEPVVVSDQCGGWRT